METPKHEQSNITIGEQEFQKVGNMNSEPTDLRSTPKNYDLYQDTESGALMGEIEESRHESWEIEKKIENLDIDLTGIKQKDLVNFLIDNQKDIKIYGSYKLKNRHTGAVSEFPLQKLSIIPNYPDVPSYDEYCMLVTEKDRQYLGIPFERERYDSIKIEKNKISERGTTRSRKPFYATDGDSDYEFSFSFYEIPEGLKELMEKKEAGE